jgi:hypothetical protein
MSRTNLESFGRNNFTTGLVFSFACDSTFNDLDPRKPKLRHAVNFIGFDSTRNLLIGHNSFGPQCRPTLKIPFLPEREVMMFKLHITKI